jgi:hypothetical protein
MLSCSETLAQSRQESHGRGRKAYRDAAGDGALPEGRKGADAAGGSFGETASRGFRCNVLLHCSVRPASTGVAVGGALVWS